MINQVDLRAYKSVKYVGDIHGLFKTLVFDAINRRKYKNCLIIVCGDIGFGFVSFKKEKENLIYLERDLAKNNICLALFRGNHDAPAAFKIDNPWRLSIEEVCPHIKIIPDYSILNTVDGNILVVGGARSIDKANRILDYSWWADEMVQPVPENFYQELNDNNIKINVVCTHTSPIFCKPFTPSKDDQGYFVEQWSKYDDTLKEDNWVERCALKIMYQDLVNNGHPVTHWIYGHFHNHFELEYEGRKFIGLDMCYQNKRRVDIEDPSTYEVVETYYKVLDDWYWLSEKGKIGNRVEK